MTAPHRSDNATRWAASLTTISDRLDASSAWLRELVSTSDPAPWHQKADAALADQADVLVALRTIIAQMTPLDAQVWQPPLHAATQGLNAYFLDSPRLGSIPLPIQRAMLDVLAIMERSARQLGHGTLPCAETEQWIFEVCYGSTDTPSIELILADCGRSPLLQRLWADAGARAHVVDAVESAGGVCLVHDDDPDAWMLRVRFSEPGRADGPAPDRADVASTATRGRDA